MKICLNRSATLWVGRYALVVFVSIFVALTSRARNEPLKELGESLKHLSETVTAAVVQVLVTGYDPELGGISSRGLLPKLHGGGSGVIVDPNGYIVTNYHVVENAVRIRVVLSGYPGEEGEFHSILKPGYRPLETALIGVDRETDLAVLKIAKSNLPHLAFGNSDDLRQGQLVMAFGSPFGLDNSVSMGVVSSIARQLSPDSPMIYIQTDAPINPGNSGGALVNTNGKLMGINTFILSKSGGSEGIGFAAPSNIVKHVYEHIRDHGRVRRGTIGAHAQTINPVMADGLGLPRNYGVILSDVFPDHSAEKAGLKTGDIVLTLDGKPMENGRQFDVNLYSTPIGEIAMLEILREGVTDTVHVTVVERPDDPGRFADLVSPEENLIPEFGILGLELNSEILDMISSTRRQSGVLVATRHLGGTPIRGGLMPGDIIYEMNNYPIGGLAGLRSLVSRLSSGDPVVLLVERQGRLTYLSFEFE